MPAGRILSYELNSELVRKSDLVNAYQKDAIFLDMRKYMMKKNCKKLQSKGQFHQFFTVFNIQLFSPSLTFLASF